jgi:hypothetical protein
MSPASTHRSAFHLTTVHRSNDRAPWQAQTRENKMEPLKIIQMACHDFTFIVLYTLDFTGIFCCMELFYCSFSCFIEIYSLGAGVPLRFLPRLI